VHINSGIPNHAFYVAATELGGKAWETLGPVWYKSLLGLQRRSGIAALARATLAAAGPASGPAAKAVAKGWKTAGVDPRSGS
jgi:Zn-dependent metalloprotease